MIKPSTINFIQIAKLIARGTDRIPGTLLSRKSRVSVAITLLSGGNLSRLTAGEDTDMYRGVRACITQLYSSRISDRSARRETLRSLRGAKTKPGVPPTRRLRLRHGFQMPFHVSIKSLSLSLVLPISVNSRAAIPKRD